MIYILGAGGFGRETLNIYIDLGREHEVKGFLEENCQRIGEIMNSKPVNDISVLKHENKNETRLIGAIGNPIRRRLIENLENDGWKFDTAIHPSVIKSRWVKIDEGCIICAGNILTNQISIGKHTIVNLSCTIGHDAIIGNYCTLSPGVHVSGRVTIGDGCYIGTGAVILPKVSIGSGSCIGAGAVVNKDIPENTLAVGVPAKPIKQLKPDDWIGLV
jgi:sugar O-acyltransferase (sialic acid O-acetyltransferase NeuD family)